VAAIRVGVIGCGYWGPNLVRNFVEIPESTVVGVADLNPKRLEHIMGCYPQIRAMRDHERLFQQDLDAVVVATPPATHFDLARDALTHGLHVLVEKPLTLTSADTQHLIELAEERQRILMVGHTFVYNPAVRALKRIIDSGEIGDVYYVDAVRVSLGLFQKDLNVLWDLAPHDVSILLYILGCRPHSVSARGRSCVLGDIEDVAYMDLAFPGEVLAHVHLSWLDPCKVRRITVVGSKKMLVYDDVENLEKIKVYDKGVESPPYTDTFGDFHFSYRYGDITIPNIRFTEPLRVECNHFLDCIQRRTSPETDGHEGLNVVNVIEAAEESLRNGGSREQIVYASERAAERVVA
jgi:predicted dehydrogenase